MVRRKQVFTVADGVEIVADIAGPDGRPTVILLHGGGQTRHSWSKTMDRLEARGYKVVNYDARGHGESGWSPNGDYSLPRLAADLSSIRATLGERVALVGASMGGMTAFYASGTNDHPFATALVMVDIALRPNPAGAAKIRNFMLAHSNGFASLEEAADAVAEYKGGRIGNSSGLSKNLRLKGDGRYYWHWDPALLRVSPSPEPPSAPAHLASVSRHVTLPTLLVRGVRSDVVTDEVVAEMIHFVPQTEVCEVQGAAHMVAGDYNDGFNRCVLPFLERHMPPV